MGLDHALYKIIRIDFESVPREDFWMVANDLTTGELIYWRKKYDIDLWFHQNTTIIEEYSDEISKEKLEKFRDWLIENNETEYAERINKIIKNNNFVENVIFYQYSN